MASLKIALATCRDFPDLDDDDKLLSAALEQTGATVTAAVWNDSSVRWKSFDAVVLRSTWDYSLHYEEFVKWLEKVDSATHLVNSGRLVRWNLDKGYLGVLGAGGVPTVPTQYVQPRGYLRLPTSGEFVLKPSISAGSRDTARYDARSDGMVAVGHAQRLLDGGRTVMIQPYIDSVDNYGETAVLFLDGQFSHAARKGALLQSGAPPTERLFAEEDIAPRTPSAAEMAVAEAALEAVPKSLGTPVYARIDLLMTPEGPALLELELAEPSMFLATSDGAADRFAAAVLQSLDDA